MPGRGKRRTRGSLWVTLLSPVALTVMGKPLSKAPDGGYYEIVGVTEDGT